MVETVLVTGGTGFIAGWCIVELLQRGYAVRTTVRDASKEKRVRAVIAKAAAACGTRIAGSETGRISNASTVGSPAGGIAGGALTYFRADLTQDAGWDAALAGCDYVLHVASPLGGINAVPGDKSSFIGPARDGTLRVLRAAVKAGVKRVVMTSAAATARPPLSSGGVSDETVWSDPSDPQFDAYRVSKILAERAAWDFMSSSGGTTEFTTVLPGAVFGRVLSADNLGSVGIIQGLLKGQPAALPQLGFWVVDVRDLADLHIRAMTSPAAAGQRFIAAGEFMWMRDIANTLRTELGSAAARTPQRQLPNFAVRLLLPFLPNLKTLAPLLGRRFPLTSEKARQVLGFSPRPANTTVVDCARSLLSSHAA